MYTASAFWIRYTKKIRLFFPTQLKTWETDFFILYVQNNRFLSLFFFYLWLNLWPKEIQSFSINTYTEKEYKYYGEKQTRKNKRPQPTTLKDSKDLGEVTVLRCYSECPVLVHNAEAEQKGRAEGHHRKNKWERIYEKGTAAPAACFLGNTVHTASS